MFYKIKEKLKKTVNHKIGKRGIALMMILWVLILLDIIVLQFASSMRTEVEITRNFKDRIEAYYLSKAGVEIAKFELKYVASMTRTHGLDENGRVDFLDKTEFREGNPLWDREVALGKGVSKIEYRAKDAKIDLNFLTQRRNENKLREFLIDCGFETDSEELGVVKASIIDWVDTDHEMSFFDSAEDDWYKDNWQGYECKDAPFYSVKELALIRYLRTENEDSEEERGRKKEILNKLYGLVDADPFITLQVYPTPPQWDPNRDETGWSDKYEVISTSWMKWGLAQRQTKALFNIKSRNPEAFTFVSWTDNYIQFEEQDSNQVMDIN